MRKISFFSQHSLTKKCSYFYRNELYKLKHFTSSLVRVDEQGTEIYLENQKLRIIILYLEAIL